MQLSLTWKKGLFSNLYKIYANGEQIGYLKNNPFTQSGQGMLKKKEYVFKTKGLLHQKTKIIDFTTNKTIGEINYSNWMNKATIVINDKTINWKYDNTRNTKWSISNSEEIHSKYAGSSMKGKIESNTEDPIILLSGLFVSNYYWQISFAI